MLEVELVGSCDVERGVDDAVAGYDVAEEDLFGRKRIRIEVDLQVHIESEYTHNIKTKDRTHIQRRLCRSLAHPEHQLT